MKKWLKSLLKSRYSYKPLITVEISRNRLLNNLNEFAKLAPNNQIAPVLKGNAYGHGLIEVADIIKNVNCVAFFAVDSYFEALALRTRGIKTPLLVIGYTRPEDIVQCRLERVSFVVGSLQSLRTIISRGKARSSLHLKIDTGMHRQGILLDEIDEAIQLFKNARQVYLEGICSHLSDADNEHTSFTDKQISSWNDIVAKFKKTFPELKYIHLSNTDGHRFARKITANVSRLGIGLYGLASNGQPISSQHIPMFGGLHLLPVMEVKTIISGIKRLHRGETVGYGNTFVAKDEMMIATIPVGYSEGIDRRLSDKGFVLVGERRIPCPIIGRVSMNITSIDLSNLNDLNEGVVVVVVSNNTQDPNCVASIAQKCDTIPYEIVVKIATHLKRVVIE